MPGQNERGLLSKDPAVAWHSQRHLYHATKAPKAPLTEAEEKTMRADGYGDEYIFQHYPKVLTLKGADGPVHVTVKDAAEEAKVIAKYTPAPIDEVTA
jgi:hypothetical protein